MKHSIQLMMVLALILSACQTDDVIPDNEGKVSLSATPLNISEDGGQSVVTASLGSVMSTDVTVTLKLGGTAEVNVDYKMETVIVVPSGEVSASVTLSTIQDEIKEGGESVVIDIESVDGASEDGVQSIELQIEDDDVPPEFKLLINEVLYDPSNNGLDGDANGDGKYVHAEDEFIEFVNLSAQAIDLSGYKIFDTENAAINSPNHLIPNGTVIQPGKAFVVFGGGTPTGSFGGATIQVSTSGDLNLNNAGDEILFVSPAGDTLLRFDIEPLSNNPNESYTRNPDLTGDFEQHGANTLLLFSPGTRVDGSAF